MEIWSIVLSAFGVVIPVVAFIWQFVIVGRKRLGYRVQMDTTAVDLVESQFADAFTHLQRTGGVSLDDPSFVLLRVHNDGIATVKQDDYQAPPGDKVPGLAVAFPNRRVVGVVVTELSNPALRVFFGRDDLTVTENPDGSGQINLPKVVLNRNQYYKVLVALEAIQPRDRSQPFADPEIVGALTVSFGGDKVRETVARTGPSRAMIALVAVLGLLSAFQLVRTTVFDNNRAPLDCATGSLTVVGSTAFEPVMREASRLYANSCPDSGFTFSAQGSLEGLNTLNQEGAKRPYPSMVAFSDGEKDQGLPNLLPRPVAFSLFTMVANAGNGVQDLTLGQIRDLAAGRIANWREVGGNDLPVRLVDRTSDSGTRRTFQARILGGVRESGDNSDDCVHVDPGAAVPPGARPGVARCARATTNDVLDMVARTPGAVGYTELSAALGYQGLVTVRIDGHAATLDNAVHSAYPFWQTEYGYTYGEPQAASLTASTLRYLTNQVGEDVIRSHGLLPCTELVNPVLCHP